MKKFQIKKLHRNLENTCYQFKDIADFIFIYNQTYHRSFMRHDSSQH